MSQSPLVIDPPGQADACIIWLHGLGADRYDFVPVVDALNLPAGHGLRFIFPQAPTRPVTINGGMPMPSWYDIIGMSPARAISQEQLQESADTVRSIVDEQVAKGIKIERIILAGFSQGGAVVLHSALQSGLALAGVMALSTYGPTIEDLLGETDKKLDMFFAHGRQDAMVPHAMGRLAHDLVEKAGHRPQWHDYNMGHEVCPQEISDINTWLRQRLSF
ncbi:alpha/beta hydrolase [uncultured Halopseudomonas sp.]|uniref:alpha/beta hydrolase n=1 Tax=uncultured Halopseudomonas sp. TaxID=2901193 RepID=UPI0030EB3F12|tara:strand:+ start:47445 stop:48101 length:657 start_codon:yes stop_codon:yes gene_type:complete